MQETSSESGLQVAAPTAASAASTTSPSTEGPQETLQQAQQEPCTPSKKPREKTNNGAEWKPLAERMRPATFDQMEVSLIVSSHLGRSGTLRRPFARSHPAGARPAALRHPLWSSRMWENHGRDDHFPTNALSLRITLLLHDERVRGEGRRCPCRERVPSPIPPHHPLSRRNPSLRQDAARSSPAARRKGLRRPRGRHDRKSLVRRESRICFFCPISRHCCRAAK